LTVGVANARVAVGRLVLTVVDALSLGARVHAESARVADVAVDQTRTRVALNSWRSTKAVEADGAAGALVVLGARASVVHADVWIGGLHVKTSTTNAHEADEAGVVDVAAIDVVHAVHALVVARETRVVKSDAALQAASHPTSR
jgi:hypothetical protein